MSPKHLSLTPGPGNYAIPSKMIEGPKTAMHARSYMKDANERNNFPGAGSYELQNQRLTKKVGNVLEMLHLLQLHLDILQRNKIVFRICVLITYENSLVYESVSN